jgi:SAM-dependent methyltransferase
MSSWSGGYHTEVQYTSHFHRHTAPGVLKLACLMNGVRPPALGEGAVYLELGCGQGFNLNVLAAANPGMRFVGVDFNPGQIANAQAFAAQAGLTNVEFTDDSFDQVLAAPEGRYPRCDVIALHGVISWISPEIRRTVMQVIDRLLKPGGMAYLSYNSLPGWGAVAPLQRFVSDYVARARGPLEVEVVNALVAAKAMKEGGAKFFGSAPGIDAKIDSALKMSPAYLVHEYLNTHFNPFYHADVARELAAAARLTYAGSASLMEDLVRLSVPEPLVAQVEATHDPVHRQTLMDYASNRMFRRDVFVRGRNPLRGAEINDALGALKFGLLRAGDPGQEVFDIVAPVCRVRLNGADCNSILDALREGPRPWSELRQLPRLASYPEAQKLQALYLLSAEGYIQPDARTEVDLEAARGFNRAVLARISTPDAPNHVAAPRLGTGAHMGFHELVALRCLDEGRQDLAAMAEAGAAALERSGSRLQKNGNVLADPAEVRRELSNRISTFLKDRLPILRAAGVV